jgi:3-hydroxybutyryl-CoA dehydratase
MGKEYYEDYRVGATFISPGRTITETDLVLYSALTGDWYEGHTNVEFAKRTVFGQRFAHGFLTLCVGTSLLFRLGVNELLPSSFLANLGVEGMRFLAPVFIGDTIKCEAELMEMTEKSETRGILTFNMRVVNQRNEKVLQYNNMVMVGRRPGGING